MFGKINRYCPNCGGHIYDNRMSNTHVLSLMCSQKCLDEWELKYARCILGKDEDNHGD